MATLTKKLQLYAKNENPPPSMADFLQVKMQKILFLDYIAQYATPSSAEKAVKLKCQKIRKNFLTSKNAFWRAFAWIKRRFQSTSLKAFLLVKKFFRIFWHLSFTAFSALLGVAYWAIVAIAIKRNLVYDLFYARRKREIFKFRHATSSLN
ncbi:hypothetical protein BDF21DRAFT_400394 [Thamnidium elegans]|nr:hypothetical protein BDF21DRAFT_400394 [Thamnidium elegans]